MAQNTGKSRDELLTLLNSLPGLEMYFPVDAHREAWEGGLDLLVSGDLRSQVRRRMISYDLKGNPVELSPTQLSPTPTLVVIRKETDFSDPLPLMRFNNTNDRGGRTIGSWVPVGSDAKAAANRAISRAILPRFTESTPDGYRSRYGLRERMFEYQMRRHLESNWLNQGDPELFLTAIGSTPNPSIPGQSLLDNRIRFGQGNDDDTDWYQDSSDLFDWQQAYGNYVNFRIWEADGDKLVPKTATFSYSTANGGTQTVSSTYERHEENDDLGQWTYSYLDHTLVTGYSGHGIGKWGFNTGSSNITIITDYVVP
jgi:hypothetical protein